MMLKKNVGNSEEAILTRKEELNPRSDVKREVLRSAYTIETLWTILTLMQINFLSLNITKLKQKIVD